MKRLLSVTLLSLACATGHAADASAPSQALGEASAHVVGGALLPVAVAGSVVVVSVIAVAHGVDLVLESAVDGSRATVRLSGKAAEGLSVAAGSAVQVSATATGHLLVASGKVIAFIPNAVGEALVRSAKVG